MSQSNERTQFLKNLVITALAEQAESGAEMASLLHNLEDIIESDNQHLVRGLELPEDLQLPGLMLLHYAAKLLANKHPLVRLTHHVIQTGHHIKMIIEAPQGDLPALEATLETFSQLMLRKLPLNKLATNEKELVECKHTLDLSALMVNINQNASMNIDDITGRAPNLEHRVMALHEAVGYGLSSMRELKMVIEKLMNEKRDSITPALTILASHLSLDMSDKDKEAVREALATVKEQEPGAFEEIREAINHASKSGSAGDLLYSWLSALSRVLPN